MDIQEEVVFNVHIEGKFKYFPLRYEKGSVMNIYACSNDRGCFSPCLDWVVCKPKRNIWAIFFCIPRKTLENGLKLIRSDADLDIMYYMAVRHGSIDLFVCHKPQKLALYYLKILSLEELVAWSEADASLSCSTSTPFNSRPHYVVNNVVNNVVKNEVKNKGVSRKVVQKWKKRKGLDKGNCIMIEYDRVLAKKSKHVDKGKGIMIEYDNKRNGKGGMADQDKITEHEESEEEIEEGVWLIKDPLKKEEGKNRGESSGGSRDGTKTRNSEAMSKS